MKIAHLVLSNSIAERVGLQSALASFDLEVRRLLGHCKEISFLDIHQYNQRMNPYKWVALTLLQILQLHTEAFLIGARATENLKAPQ